MVMRTQFASAEVWGIQPTCARMGYGGPPGIISELAESFSLLGTTAAPARALGGPRPVTTLSEGEETSSHSGHDPAIMVGLGITHMNSCRRTQGHASI